MLTRWMARGHGAPNHARRDAAPNVGCPQPHYTKGTPRRAHPGGVAAPGAHLVQLPHGAQRLDLVAGVLAFLQALVADGALALHAVHAVVLQLVVGAGGDLSGAEAPAHPALSRRHQAMLGQRSPRWVAAQAAGLTVEDVALLAHHRRLLGRLLAQLAAQGGRPALLVAVDDGFQQPVPGETSQAALVQAQTTVALRARQAGAAGRWRRSQS